MINMSFNAPMQEKYKQNVWGDPGDDYDPSKKKDDMVWFRKKAEWLYSLWLNGNAYIPFATTNEFARLRRYAQGNQPNAKYMDILCPVDTHTGERKGYMNISWDTLPIYSAFRDRARGALNKFDYATSVQCLDQGSHMEREMMKWKAYVEEQEKEWLDSIKADMSTNIEMPKQEEPMMKPRTIEEMNMMANMGSYQLPIESAFEGLLRKSEQLSEWEEIKVKLQEDLIDIGYIAVQDYTDPVSGKPRVRYVDPQYLIIASNRDNAYTTVADAGEVRFFTVGELKDYGFDDNQIREMAQAYQGMYGNPAFNTLWRNGAWVWDQLTLFRVAIMDFDFESFDTYTFEYRNINGLEKPFKLGYGEAPEKPKKNKYEKNKYARRYRGKWVIGTSIVFDYGYQYNQIFDSENRPKSSYSVYRVADRSMTSRCVATIDDLHLALYKFRNAWAMAAPSGFAVEWGSLSNMKSGENKMSPMDIIKIYRQNGQLLWKASMENGRVMNNGQPPIFPIEGGLGRILQEFMQTFEMHVNTIRQITAIGQGLDGNVSTGDLLKGTLQIAEASLTDTLRPCLSAYKRVKSRAFDNLCLRWQLYLASEDINEITEGSGAKLISLTYNDVSKRRIQVVCDMLIDDSQKQLLLSSAQQSMQQAKSGGVGITYLDFVFILQAIERGQIKYASMWLAYREELALQQQMMMQQQNMQMNGQNMQQQEQMKQQSMQMEAEMKSQLTQLEVEGTISKAKVQGQEDRKTLLTKFMLEQGQMPPEDMFKGVEMEQEAQAQAMQQQAMMEQQAAMQQQQQEQSMGGGEQPPMEEEPPTEEELSALSQEQPPMEEQPMQ